MAPRRHSIGLVAVLFGLLPTLLIASCVVEATGPRSPDVVTGDGAITVASFDFPESVLLAEIYALSETDDITEETAEQMLLRLRERRLQRQLSDAQSDHFLELQQRLAEVRTAIREFA